MAEYHVSINGTATGNGTASSPWDLQTALNHPASVRPGDTIWLHGGVYAGSYTSTLQGTSIAPIKVRSYPGEWAIIDNAGKSLVALWVASPKYVWFWGFEIRNSGPTPNRDESGVNFGSSEGMKLINVVVHDEGSTGLNPWTSATDAEIYGCVVYYNGRMEDINHKNGYGIYGQNTLPSRKTIEETFFFNMFSIFPIHYGGSSASKLDNTRFVGNTIFGHTLYDGKNVIAIHGQFEVGGGKCVQVEWSSNFFYRADLWLGYNSDGIEGMVLKDNYFFRGNISNNAGNTYAVNTGNVYTSTGDQVFVRPNKYADQYDLRRANIIIFNGSKLPTVSVSLPPGTLQAGDSYEIKDVQNYFGPAILTGTYTGGAISVPMPGASSPISTPRNVPVQRPGSSQPAHTDNEFGAFVLLRTSTTPSNVAVSIISQPQNASILVGQTATFTISVSGTLPITYQWQKNGVNISGASSNTYTTPLAAIADDGATFRCIATNIVGSVVSMNATLTVTTAPPTRIPISISVIGSGAVSVNGTFVTSPYINTYVPGTIITITATPVSGWVFSGWSGSVSDTNQTISVTVNSSMSFIASFTEVAPPPPPPPDILYPMSGLNQSTPDGKSGYVFVSENVGSFWTIPLGALIRYVGAMNVVTKKIPVRYWRPI